MGGEQSANRRAEAEEDLAEEEEKVLQTQDKEHLWTILHEEASSVDGEESCVFTRTPGKGFEAELCCRGVQHLRHLRHPNILKFLCFEQSGAGLVLRTEPVVPLGMVLGMGGLCAEGRVVGWRGVAEGLHFLHSKAGLSHNNLHAGCIFVSTSSSQWRIGGMEAMELSSKMDAEFLKSILPIRHPTAVPPEDKEKGVKGPKFGAGVLPGHSRDVWAFGQLLLDVVKGKANTGDATMLSYVQQRMLHQNPSCRPTMKEILAQCWMRNEVTEIIAFLSNLAIKTSQQKKTFFSGLNQQIHSLPSSVVSEYLIPHLLTPFVMRECGRGEVWRDIFTLSPSPSPSSPTSAFQGTLDIDQDTCPVLAREEYKAHVLPTVFNLLQCREKCVRLILLQHLKQFASCCSKEDLTRDVLPEVLVGLQDSCDEVVGATLRSLGDLVDMLGAQVVMGTTQRTVFAEAAPRVVPPLRAMSEPGGKSLDTPHDNFLLQQSDASRIPVPVSDQSDGGMERSQRMELMRQRREEQRQKMQAKQKLGKALGRLPKEPDNPSPPATPTAQYSPSVSHDEEEDPTTPVHNEVEGPGLGDSEEESFVLQADSSVDNLLKELEPAIVQPLAVGGWEEEGEGEGEEEGEGEGEGGWGAGVDVRDDGGAKKRMDYQPNTNEEAGAEGWGLEDEDGWGNWGED